MPRIPKIKELTNTRLANGYGGWIYCEGCQKTIGYLCYVTYDGVRLEYECKCGGHGSLHLSFAEEDTANEAQKQPIIIKNRWCCPSDQSPLLTVMEEKLNYYRYEIVCKTCNSRLIGEKRL